MGANFPPVGGSSPTCPQLEEKMAKISHFRQIFGFLPPQNRILPPRYPPQKKKISGAATGIRSIHVFRTFRHETVNT